MSFDLGALGGMSLGDLDLDDLSGLSDLGDLGSIMGLAGGESPLGTSLQEIAGPLFLGFAFQFFGMGIVLVLTANYFSSITSRPKSPAESSRRIGVILVTISLLFNLGQTCADMYRGWQMFATNFMNLLALLTPSVLYFLSPFLGIIPAAITQIFLLRRCLLFIKSLSNFWPRLAHPVTRWAFGMVLTSLILVSSAAGTAASVMIWKSPNLWSLEPSTRESSPFERAQLTWLSISSGIDVVLSAVLCLELWWARNHLASKGGSMRKIVTRLIFVTFHGGLAVTVIQITALFLYKSSKTTWCYFPVLSLPKVYTITLLLSLSLPQANNVGPTPSHVFSLPTIATHSVHPSFTLPPSPPASLRALSPKDHAEKATAKDQDKDRERHQRKVAMERMKNQVEKSWRASQEWLNWSMSFSRGGSDKLGEAYEPKAGRRWSRQEDVRDSKPDLGIQMDYRRPSEPNSLAPLLGTPTHRRPSTLALSGSVLGSPLAEHLSDISPTTAPHLAHPLSPWHRLPMDSAGMGLQALVPPVPSITVDRSHSFSAREDRRMSAPERLYGPSRRGSGGRGAAGASETGSWVDKAVHDFGGPWQGGEGREAQGRMFDTTDPFATVRSPNTPPSTAQGRSPMRPPISPLGHLRIPMSDPGHASQSHNGTADDGEEAVGGGGDDDDEERRRARAASRMFSFEDMLSNGPDGGDGRKRPKR